MSLFLQRGFTLIEVVVVIGIIGVASTSMFGLINWERGNRFDSDVQKTLSELRRLQTDARTVDNNKEYGMQFMGNSWISFYQDPATGARTNITTQPLGAASLAWAVSNGTDQIVFERLTGKPEGNASATLTFTVTSPSRTSIIKIDQPGVVYVQ